MRYYSDLISKGRVVDFFYSGSGLGFCSIFFIGAGVWFIFSMLSTLPHVLQILVYDVYNNGLRYLFSRSLMFSDAGPLYEV